MRYNIFSYRDTPFSRSSKELRRDQLTGDDWDLEEACAELEGSGYTIQVVYERIEEEERDTCRSQRRYRAR